MKKIIITQIIACLLILLFVYAGMSKLLDHRVFSLQLTQSPLIGRWAAVIAWVLPAGELLLAVSLVLPATRLFGLYLSLGLLLLFTVYLLYMLGFSVHLPCSCGGVIRYMSWKQHVVFNCVFILLAAMGIRLQRGIKNSMQDIVT